MRSVETRIERCKALSAATTCADVADRSPLRWYAHDRPFESPPGERREHPRAPNPATAAGRPAGLGIRAGARARQDASWGRVDPATGRGRRQKSKPAQQR